MQKVPDYMFRDDLLEVMPYSVPLHEVFEDIAEGFRPQQSPSARALQLWFGCLDSSLRFVLSVCIIFTLFGSGLGCKR